MITFVGWDDVPRRPLEKLKPSRGSLYSNLLRDPILVDGIPEKKSQKGSISCMDDFLNKNRIEGWARGIRAKKNLFAIESHRFAPKKVQWLFSDLTHSYYKVKCDALPMVSNYEDITNLNLNLLVHSTNEFMGSDAFGLRGVDPIKVSLELEKNNNVYSDDLVQNKTSFSCMSIHNWWITI